MKFFPKNSIASYLAIPQVVAANNSNLPLQSVAKPIKEFRHGPGGDKMAQPDQQAIEFYCLNHLAAIIQQRFNRMESLPVWAQVVMDGYQQTLVDQSRRLFSYMMLIVTRECRHMGPADTLWFEKLEAASCPEMATFVESISGKDISETMAVSKLMNSPPDVTVGNYLRAIAHSFNEGTFASGFGGKPWGKITQCVLDMVEGKTSLEIMSDSAFCLAHNNGPMFNKGMLYHGHSQGLIKILDVQRSGQIPEAVLSNAFGTVAVGYSQQPSVSAELHACVTSVKGHCPEAFGEYVDWYKVESLGAVQKYTNDKLLQKKKYGLPKHAEAMEAAAIKIEEEKAAAAAVQAAKIKEAQELALKDYQEKQAALKAAQLEDEAKAKAKKDAQLAKKFGVLPGEEIQLGELFYVTPTESVQQFKITKRLKKVA